MFIHPAFCTHWRGFIGRQEPTRASQRVGTVVGAADVGSIDHQSLAHRFYTKKPWKLVVQHGAFHYLPSNLGSFGWQWDCRLTVNASSGHFLHCCRSLFFPVTALPMVTPACARMWHLNLLQWFNRGAFPAFMLHKCQARVASSAPNSICINNSSENVVAINLVKIWHLRQI